MACYRNSIILREILGYAPYQVEQKIAFQNFDLSDVTLSTQQQSSAA
jgi:lysine N6-hydroxylase